MGQTIYDRLLKESKHYDGWLYIGDDKTRYALGQPGANNLIVIGINPSSATPEKDDPTIRRVRKTAEMNGFDGWIMLNIYPVRSAKPEDMPEKVDKQLSRYNIAVIRKIMEENPVAHIWSAWGDAIDSRDYYMTELQKILDVTENEQWFRKGTLTRWGNPRHPLYLPYKTEFTWFPVQDYIWSVIEL